jgi:hypothetical protein
MGQAASNGRVQTRFLRSVNAERDHRDADALAGYLLTAGGRRVLQRLTSGAGDNGSGAWTLTGPYGTGKSAFSVFALQLLAPASYPGHTRARAVLKQGGETEAAHPKAARGLWPVAVTGSRDPLNVALLRGLNASVSASRAKGAQPLAACIARAIGKASRSGLGDKEVTDLFADALETICSGAGSPSGLFIVVDELGKLLEFAAAHPGQSDVYVLQGLAEWAARSSKPVLLLTVLHQDFAQYADRLSATERAEWDKVRGRFEDIVFEEPADELLRLVANARAGAAKGPEHEVPEHFVALCKRAAKLQLVPSGMPKGEFLDLLTQSWPLHPLVSVLLGHVFRKLAQNERSAFSFLSSSEPYGLAEYVDLAGPKSPYGLHHLYDYLVHALGDGLYMQRNGKRWAEVESVLDRLPDAGETAVAVLKTIGILNAVGEWRRIVPSREVIEYALAGTAGPREVAEALEYLAGKSAVMNRRYNATYALWQGSDIDVEERVNEARGRLDPSQTTASLAQRYAPVRPLVARRHSFETGTLRHLTVQFVHLDGSLRGLPEGGVADGHLVIVVPENPQDAKRLLELPATDALAGREDILVAVPEDVRPLANAVRELACLDWVRQHTPELEGDATARRELRARGAEVLRTLETVIAKFLTPSTSAEHACSWFWKGRKLAFASRRELQGHVSVMCQSLYPAAPVILNELINRRELSSAAAAGRRNLFQAMLEHAGEEHLGIEGYPPERSMYLSVLAKPGLHRMVDGVWQFTNPSPRADAGIKAAWGAIQTFFDGCEKEARPLSELVELLAARPFGLRAGPIPVLVGAALIAADADVAVYEDGSFLPQLSISAFERFVKAPRAFTVRRWRVTGVRAAVFHQLAEMLGRNRDLFSVGKRNVLEVVRPLLKFVAQLPDYVRQTDRLSPTARNVRDALLRAREADQLLFVDLPRACGVPPFDSDNQKAGNDLAGFMAELKRGLAELQRCHDDLLTELAGTLGNAFAMNEPLPKLRRGLATRAEALRSLASDAMLRNFIARVTDAVPDDQGWVEAVSSLLSEKPPAQWRDADRGKFEVALAKVSRLFSHLEVLAFASNGKADGGESVRIGVTTSDQPERERVVHVPPASQGDVNRLEALLHGAIKQAGINGHKDLALAALARVTQKLLS